MATEDLQVYGERIEDLLPGFIRLHRVARARSDGSVPEPLMLPAEEADPIARALHRAEAEVLLEDAETVVSASNLGRSRAHCRADAFLRLVQAVAASAPPSAFEELT